MNWLQRCAVSTCAWCVSLLLAGCAAPGGDSTGGPFTSMSLAEARESVAQDGGVLMVYATASWCGPCQRMQQTTWRDPAVAEWFDEHGVAFKFDVDEKRDLSREFRIEAMPTMIALVDGTEVGRVIGLQTTDQLLSWLKGVREGL